MVNPVVSKTSLLEVQRIVERRLADVDKKYTKTATDLEDIKSGKTESKIKGKLEELRAEREHLLSTLSSYSSTVSIVQQMGLFGDNTFSQV